MEDAVDFFDIDALESSVGDIAVHHLALEGAVIEGGNLAWGVTDFVLGKPDDGRIFGGVGLGGGFDGSVAVESTGFDDHDFAAREPVALVIGYVEFAKGAESDSVGSAEPGDDEFEFSGARIDFHGATSVDVLRLG